MVQISSLISVVTARLYRGSVDVGGNGGGIDESSSSSSSIGVLGVSIGLKESLKRNKDYRSVKMYFRNPSKTYLGMGLSCGVDVPTSLLIILGVM